MAVTTLNEDSNIIDYIYSICRHWCFRCFICF